MRCGPSLKKQKNVDEGDGDGGRQGDCWVYIAKKADTKLHLAHRTGKRVQATADTLMETVRKRGKKPTEDEKATFISDGNDQYITAILANFEVETINYGQLIKERERGRVVGKTRMVIVGDVDDAGIDTVYVERYNITLRHGISRLAGQEKFVLFQVQGDVG